jgi:hypothetical protein
MAVPILAKAAPEAYVRLLKVRAENYHRVRLSVLEKHVFGWTHAKVAEIMARQWRLPEVLADLIRVHVEGGQSSDLLEQEPGELAVSLSALLPAMADPCWGERDSFQDYYTRVCPTDGPSIEKLLGQVDEEYGEFAAILRISAPEVPLLYSFVSAEPISS